MAWIGGIAVVVGGGLVIIGSQLGWFGTVLDNAKVAEGVRQTLTGHYGIADVQSVTCPADQPIKPGHRFSCTVVIAGDNKPVAITVLDTAGNYEVASP